MHAHYTHTKAHTRAHPSPHVDLKIIIKSEPHEEEEEVSAPQKNEPFRTKKSKKKKFTNKMSSFKVNTRSLSSHNSVVECCRDNEALHGFWHKYTVYKHYNVDAVTKSE